MKRHGPIVRWSHRVLLGSGLLLSLLTITAFAAAWWWPLALVEALRIQLGLALLVVALVQTLIPRRRLLALGWLLGTAVNACVVIPLWGPAPVGPVPPPNTDHTPVSILHLNINAGNRQLDRVAQAIEGSSADLVFIQELSPFLRDELSPRLPSYHLQTDGAERGSRGIGLYTRKTPQMVTTARLMRWHTDERGRNVIAATITTPAGPLHVLSVHLKRPGTAKAAETQSRELDAIAAWLTDLQPQDGPTRPNHHARPAPHAIVIGDFNMPPWSHGLQRLTASTSLQPAPTAWRQPTWPAPLPKPLQTPIDLALHSPGVQIHTYQPLPSVGSDHLPLLVRASLLTPSP
ncbi:MAG: endonuclease/exonuclease/phosphatase family protein [Planctomycetota bacterium]